MEVYRIQKKAHKDIFPPRGSLYSAGRWNTKGMWVVYTSDSVALAKLEALANSGIIPKNRYLSVIEIKDNTPLIEIDVKDLPKNWNQWPYPPELAKMIRNIIASQKYAGAIVPSAQSPRDKNILLFPDFSKFDKYVKEKEQSEELFDYRLKP